jgi:branched-chain amino acid transport system permease protein
VRTTRLKVGTFVASAFVPGMVGSLYACYLGYIDPTTAFAPAAELTVIAMVLLGGMGTVFGPLVGALALSGVNEVLWARFPAVYLALVGVIVLVAVLYMPRGIVNYAQRRAWSWVPAARGHLRGMADRKKPLAKP